MAYGPSITLENAKKVTAAAKKLDAKLIALAAHATGAGA